MKAVQNVRKSGQIVRIVMWSRAGGQVVREVGLVIRREGGRTSDMLMFLR